MQKKLLLFTRGIMFTLLFIFALTQFGTTETSYAYSTKDTIDFLSVDTDNDTLDWDSDRGPWYSLCLSTGELIFCTGDDAEVLSYSREGDIVTVTVYSSELPIKATYVLDLTQPFNSDRKHDADIRSYGTLDYSSLESKVTKVETLYFVNAVSFDTEKGPTYQLDLSTGEIKWCSDPHGKVISYSKDDLTITVTVISDMLPCEKPIRLISNHFKIRLTFATIANTSNY